MSKTAEMNRTAPGAHRSSKDVQSDIGRLQALLNSEINRLNGLETAEGSDYQTLLASGPGDTSVIDQIAKANAQISVLQRALVAANADLEAAMQNELQSRRAAARDAIQSQFDRALVLSKQVEVCIDQLAVHLNEMKTLHRNVASEILQASKHLGVVRVGHHLMEARKSLEEREVLGNLVQLAIYKRTELIRPENIPPGYMRPLSQCIGETYTQAATEVSEALGLTGGN